MLDVKFRVFKGEKYLCAAGIGVSIFTQGKTWNSLVKNIHEAIMCHYDLSSMEGVRVTLVDETQVDTSAETASC
jgi:hypothetical protein